jgi:predicted nucleotidyltransferase
MNAERYAVLSEALERIVHTLVTEYQPEKIILFGSMATGDVGEWSDIDLALIKDTPKRFIDRLKEVARLCHAKVAVDYFIYTPAEFEHMIAIRHPFVRAINEQGKVLYERRNVATVA